MDRLQIGSLRLTLLEGEAKFNSPTLKTLDAVESYLEIVQAFLEEWLQAAQPPPKPPVPSPEETALRKTLFNFASGLRRNKVWKDDIELLGLPSLAERLAPRLKISTERAAEIADDVVRDLKK